MDGAANTPSTPASDEQRPKPTADVISQAAGSPAEVVGRDSSRCLTCAEPSDALVLEREGRIYQRVLCKTHAPTEHRILSDSRLHHKLDDWNRRVFSAVTPPVDEQEDKAPLLAVIDLTNRCNQRCPVCFADVVNGNGYYLDLETVRGMLRALVERESQPCRHIQFSGGEPTLHPQFLEILAISRQMGFDHVQVATNGTRFANYDFARRCEEAGLHTLYLQFDGMNDDVYLALRGQPLVQQKMRIFENLVRTNMRAVLVPTIVAGLNVDQLGPIFRFALEHSQHVTGISVQPMAATGRVKVPRPAEAPFDLGDLALEFSRQTGLTRVPDDWFPLNALTMLTRGVAALRGETPQSPACDAHCSVGTYFYIDDDNRPTCLTSFLDLERLLIGAGELKVRASRSRLFRSISTLQQLTQLSACFDASRAPRGLSFLRLLRGLDGWEDKSVGRARRWFHRGFNGMFVAGMHFMDSTNYSARRVGRCIIKYVTTDGQVLSFCRYNAGERYRTIEEANRLAMCERADH